MYINLWCCTFFTHMRTFTPLSWFSTIHMGSVHDVEHCGEHSWCNKKSVMYINVWCCTLFTHMWMFTALTWFSIIHIGSTHDAKQYSQHSWCKRQFVMYINVWCCTLFTHMWTFTVLTWFLTIRMGRRAMRNTAVNTHDAMDSLSCTLMCGVTHCSLICVCLPH